MANKMKKRISFKLAKFVGPTGSSPRFERRNKTISTEPSMCDGVFKLLSIINEKWPTDGRKHHLTLGNHGLELGLWVSDECRRFLVTPEDLSDPARVIPEIEYLLAFPAPPLPPRADSRDLATGGES